jgi:aldehyde dehydrogenase (NAD+)
VAPDYILVKKGFEEKLLSELKKTITDFYGENPQENKDYSRIVTKRHTQRLAKFLENKEIYLGGKVDLDDNYVSPTILLNLKEDDDIMNDEIFGPILPVLTVDKLSDATAYINKRDKPLALYIFTKNQKYVDYIVNNTQSGAVGVNEVV